MERYGLITPQEHLAVKIDSDGDVYMRGLHDQEYYHVFGFDLKIAKALPETYTVLEVLEGGKK